MRLTVLMADAAGQRYSCHGCTNCCRELVVHLTARDVKKIDRQGWRKRLDAEPYVRLGRSTVLNQHGGACVFLSAAGRCRIHEDFGEDAKPLACRLYPFSLHPTARGLEAAIRFDCPSVAAARGEPLKKHTGAVERLADEFEAAQPGIWSRGKETIELAPARHLSEREDRALVRRADAILQDTNRPLLDRLLELAALVDTLRRARLENVRDERFEELLDLLAAEQPDVAAELAPPTARQLRLLRIHVFAHCESVGLEQAQASAWSAMVHRLRQLRKGRRMRRGDGPIPSLAPGRFGGTFDQLEQIGCAASHAQVCELLTRYLRLRLASGTAFGSGYYGWPALLGLCALLLAVPSTLWLARYLALADGRPAWTQAGLERAVGLFDRAVGRAKEPGAASARWRVGYLAADRGIASLIYENRPLLS